MVQIVLFPGNNAACVFDHMPLLHVLPSNGLMILLFFSLADKWEWKGEGESEAN